MHCFSGRRSLLPALNVSKFSHNRRASQKLFNVTIVIPQEIASEEVSMSVLETQR